MNPANFTSDAKAVTTKPTIPTEKLAQTVIDVVKHDPVAAEIIDTGTEYLVAGRRFVRKNPFLGVGIAAAVGVLAGSLLMRKR